MSKTILILAFVLSSVADAQNNALFPVYDAKLRYIFIDPTLYIPDGYSSSDIRGAVRMLEFYRQACWNDSSFVEEHTKPGWSNLQMIYQAPSPCWPKGDIYINYYPQFGGRTDCQRPEHWFRGYRHREPTVDGFEQWIRELK